MTPSGAAAVASGSTVQLSATPISSTGSAMQGAVTWSSSNEQVASVSNGLVTARLVGSSNITASFGSVTSTPLVVTVTPGAPARLSIRTQPAGAAARIDFTTQPVLEVQDAAGNVAPVALAVTAAIASGGGTLGGTATVTSSNGVATFAGLSIAGLIGARTLSFSAPGVAGATSQSFTLTAGSASVLTMRTQPVAGTAYAVFPTPPAVDVRDADGNTSSLAIAVTATVASGGGATSGGITVTASNGVATFPTLVIAGAAGARTLLFTAPGLTSVTSASFNVTTAPPAILTVSPTSATLQGSPGLTPPTTIVQVTNTGVFPLTNLRLGSVDYGEGQPFGWLSAAFNKTTAPAELTVGALTPSVPGNYSAVLRIYGDGQASTLPMLYIVNLTALPQLTNAYGTPDTRVSLLNAGESWSPTLVTRSASGAPTTDPTLGFVSRSPSVATVNADGRITAVAEGSAWIVATSTRANQDSVFVIVPRAGTGPVLRLDLTKFDYRVGDTISAKVLLDMRGSGSLGAITMSTGWTSYTPEQSTQVLFQYVSMAVPSGTFQPSHTYLAADYLVRTTGATATGIGGVVEIGTLRLRARIAGAGWIYLNALEVLNVDLASLLPVTTTTQYPIVVSK